MTDHEKNVIILNGYANLYVNNLNLNELEPAHFSNEDESITIPRANEDAFTLNPLKAGTLQQVIPIYTTDNKGVAVVRMIIGYGMLEKLASNKHKFNFHFSLWLNAMLATLKRNMGDLSNRQITIKRPGEDGLIFKDLENSAAIELRMYVSRSDN